MVSEVVKHVVKPLFRGVCGRIVRAFEAGFRSQNARKWAISGEKQRKKEILANLLFGLSDKT